MSTTSRTGLIENIINAVNAKHTTPLLSKFQFESNKENELLFFLKPSCFQQTDNEKIKRILEMVFEKFSYFKVDMSGCLLLSGKRLEELSIMDRHYGFINKLSREAGKTVSPGDLKKIHSALDIEAPEKYRLLGGHEFLKEFPSYDEESLDLAWREKDSIKLRSGFYFRDYVLEGNPVILVNGFHPAQLRHYTKPEHKILVFLLHSNVSWKVLKNDMGGDTYPENANKISVRGEMFANKSRYGLAEVSISNNCIHLSAGPFEALYEIINFFKNIPDSEYRLKNTNLARLMVEKGREPDELQTCLANPTGMVDEKQTDLFSFTEEKSTKESVQAYLDYFSG